MTQDKSTEAEKAEDLAQEVPINHSDASSEQATEEPVEAAEAAEASAAAAEVEPPEPTLEEQLAEMKGNYLRALAESENYRKRMAREILDTREQTRVKTIGEMVGIYDLLQMAVEHASKATDVAALRQGLEMSFGEFKRILKGMGVEVLDAVGQPFDPSIHEAMSTLNSDEVPDGVVLQQWKPGFKIGEKLLRPATVVVSKGPANPPPVEATASDGAVEN
ncbi:MAG: nucleotide exchange factor GrpE [Victivallales bacterium]|nr:nucleotide exchange factor GrpE [Victivallales bacterium]